MTSNTERNLELEKLVDRINEVDDKLVHLAVVIGSLEQWQAEQTNSIIGRLRLHVKGQIATGQSALENFQAFQRPEIPSEQVRIDARKKFHSRLLRRLNRNLFLGLFIALAPYLVELLDSMGKSTPILGAIYPTLGISILALSILSPLIRRGRPRGKSSSVWIGLGIGVGLLICIWPLVRLYVRFAVNSGYFPLLWQVILGASILMLLTFLRAVLQYAGQLGDFQDGIQDAHAILESRRGGSVKIRTEIARLKYMEQQLGEWEYIIGSYLRRPWIVKDRARETSDWEKYAVNLPKSIRIANALETSEGPMNPVQKTINERINSESGNGWRVRGLSEFIKLAPQFEESASPLKWSGIDQDNPVTQNGSLKRLRALVDSERYLEMVGEDKVSELVPDEQDRILARAELEVKAISASKGQPEVTTWDEHLCHVVGDLRNGEPPLAAFAIKPEYSPEGLNARNITSIVLGPDRLIRSLQREYKDQVSSKTELIPTTVQGSRHIDLVMRMDFAGLAEGVGGFGSSGAIQADRLLWPGDSNNLLSGESDEEKTKFCASCGKADCPAATTRAKCTETGI